VIIIAAIAVFSRSQTSPTRTQPISEEPIDISGPTEAPTIEATGSPTTEATTKDVTVTGKNFSFAPNEIRVKQGDTVRVTFMNQTGTHDWRLDEFKAATKIVQSGQQETVVFVADKKGQFEYYCSVGNHRQMGMRGTLIVE